ncbi:L-methionine/branched-chain amino acid transporter [Vibrio neptunius]|uniref:L-methionine/branched-chain amino acid transporter n=1 Tax=Vibrio neptunius TaxID=170651 RepID=A0ABS3A8C4_9VIBR|nr:L-methionine/branched-chain amino acid transporter [Vibrio neptunius]MBN3495384.1 L-methionine/branched-chain amino acid transporter [Vibrio neptunius]MBN3517896.1 L-methionine/branched-chain amino acid transporter [Vibrio neptunius]MBN3552237.1 L-methionine/branched-chain amino acid transporter [Vibrio neptunius]MBN3580230.1 L-methionine/branched-chain amino acid transporter [Vibrio neptunius]MCH9873896.1 L-methionine/branched-chain amino acid transporter [Vibrio neptunius]
MSQLKQEITLLSGIGQLSTTLLGTGLFMVPAIAAGIAGSLSLWAWLILFVAICPIALTFAQLGKRYPNAGGTAHFVRQAFDKRLEKSVAWLFVSVIPVGVPAAVALAAGFLQQLLPEALNSSIFAQLLTVLLLIAVNLAGTKSSGRLQTLIALSIFTLVAAFWWKGDVGAPDLTMPVLTSESTWSIGAALAVMFWCFVGIEAFAHMGEEFKNPQRDFPIAIIIGCFVAGAIYWACSVVIIKFGAYGSSEFDSASIPWLSEMLFGKQLKLLISVLGFAACFASVNLYTQSLSRMVWSQAREYKPQSPLARVSVRGVPANATLAVGVVLILSCLVGEISGLDLEFFLKLANGIFVLVYLLAMLSACKLLTGISQWLAGLSLLICTGVFICLGWSMLYAVAVFALLSLPWGKRQTLEQRQAKERT